MHKAVNKTFKTIVSKGFKKYSVLLSNYPYNEEKNIRTENLKGTLFDLTLAEELNEYEYALNVPFSLIENLYRFNYMYAVYFNSENYGNIYKVKKEDFMRNLFK